MCALPEVKDDVPVLGAGVGGEGEGSGVRTPTVESVPALAGGGKPGQQAQGGGGGKKKGKKGKKWRVLEDCIEMKKSFVDFEIRGISEFKGCMDGVQGVAWPFAKNK
jgi:hypothetical protein